MKLMKRQLPFLPQVQPLLYLLSRQFHFNATISGAKWHWNLFIKAKQLIYITRLNVLS